MLNSPTIARFEKYKTPLLKERCILNNSLETNLKPNCKAAMNIDYEIPRKTRKSRVILVNKTYEMYNGSLSESYFDISDNNEAKDYIDDYANNLNKGLILVINGHNEIDEVLNFSNSVHDGIKLIISYNNIKDRSHYHFNSVPHIITNSVNEAVNEAYNRIENGQSILFTHVSSSFDLFEHMELV